MKFSIIIPVRAINEYIREGVFHIKKLKYADFEVIIITDEKENYDFEDNRFFLLDSGKVGPGEKRNLGAKMATGEILAFLDDDAYPAVNWLTEASGILANQEIYALGGPAVTPLEASFHEKCSGKVLESRLSSAGVRYRHIPLNGCETRDYPSVNLFIRKEAFEKVGGYPVEFWPGEDTKLCLDLVKAYGKPFIYDPRPVVYHHRRNSYLPYLKQVSRYGRYRGRFAKIFPETSKLPYYFVPSYFVLGLSFGPVLSTFFPLLWLVYFSTIAVYLTLVSWEMIQVYRSEKNIKLALYSGLGIFLTNVVYGIYFIYGYFISPKLILRGVDNKSGSYVGG